MTKPTLLIAGGGTGGHLFPAVAVAEAAMRMADVEVVFVGTDRGIEARVVPMRGWRLERLTIEPIKGGGAARAFRSARLAARATIAAASIVRRLRPRAVLGVGGYAGGPATLAAAVMGVPVAILESNSTVGLANRWLAPFAQRAFLAWPEAEASFRQKSIRQYGVPLRPGFAPAAIAQGRATARVLVMGGSQGAAELNERLPRALAQISRLLHGRQAAERPSAAPPIEVLHQAGRGRDGAVREAYAGQNIERVVVVPFIDDVARALTDADLVVARAGAGTIAEITAVGRPSILVPFPHAADDHQGRNAESLAHAGAAVCIRQERAAPEILAAEIARLVSDQGARLAMGNAARARGRPDAARHVARDFLSLASISEHAIPEAGQRPTTARWS